MATKDLIKKMTSSQAIKPKVLESKRADAEKVKIVDVVGSIEETVQHEITKIEESEKAVTVEFVTRELKILKQSIHKYQQQVSNMQGKIEATYGLVNSIHSKIEENQNKKLSLWKRLFRKCP